MLSGYLIGGQLLRHSQGGTNIAFGTFYFQRALRILPAYGVVLAVYFLSPSLRETPLIQPFWQFASFTENLLIDYSKDKAFSHVWSLCVEEHFYLFFPACLWCVARKPSVYKTCSMLLGFVALGILVRTLIFEDLHATPARPGTGYRYFELIYYPTYARLDGLLVGVAIACWEYFRPASWSKLLRSWHVTLPCALTLSALAYLVFSNRFGFLATTIGFPVLSLGLGFWLILACSLDATTSSLRVPGAEVTAKLAFALYLSHKLVFTSVKAHLLPLLPENKVAVFCAYALPTVLAATVLHLAVELPVLAWRDRRLKKPQSTLSAQSITATEPVPLK